MELSEWHGIDVHEDSDSKFIVKTLHLSYNIYQVLFQKRLENLRIYKICI